MSRFKRFVNSLLSGYALLTTNVLYTFASVRVAVHYLADEDFGLWAVVTQVSSYLLLIDLGMSGSVSRILIDHKDDKESTSYGSVIQTGFLVLLVQGAAIALLGAGLSYWLPQVMNLKPHLWDISRKLMAWQCGILACSFVGRIFGHILQAHQRFDVQNYSQILTLIISFFVLCLGFQQGMGLYSQILASALGFVFNIGFLFVFTLRLRVYPKSGMWGRPSYKVFRELFSFGSDLFLLTVGLQLTTASQTMLLGRTLGLETAAVWANLTKTFMLGQQFVGRIFDYSASTLSEMAVRGENTLLQNRFRDIVILTASVSVLVGAGLASVNDAFVTLWLKGRFGWDSWNNWAMALMLVVTCVSRCHVGLLGQTKDVGSMRYVYFIEGVCFVTMAYLLSPYFGFPSVIFSAIASNIMWSGTQGIRRTAARFKVSTWEIGGNWTRRPLSLLLVFWPIAMICWWWTRSLEPLMSIAVNASVALSAGGWAFWHCGLTQELQAQCKRAMARGREAIARKLSGDVH